MNNIGKRIEGLLEEKKMCNEEFAEKVGITEYALHMYLSGGWMMRAPLICKTAEVLGSTVEYIFDGIEPEKPVEKKTRRRTKKTEE